MGIAANAPAGADSFSGVRPRTRRERLAAGGMCVAAFLCFYVLTAGPMAGLHKAFALPPFRKGVEILYAPIVALYKSGIEPFATFLKWYIDLFR